MAISLASYKSDTSAAVGQRDSGIARTVSPTLAIGDFLVIFYVCETNLGGSLNTPPTATGLTLTQRGTVAGTSGTSGTWCWTTNTASAAGAVTVSLIGPASGSDRAQMMVVYVVTGGLLAATPATGQGQNATLSAPSATLTSTGTGSTVLWAGGDGNAVGVADCSTAVYLSSAVQDQLSNQLGTYYLSAYAAHQAAAAAGSQTFGQSSPSSQKWSAVGVEVLTGAASSTLTHTRSIVVG